jgi:hypothetical protein
MPDGAVNTITARDVMGNKILTISSTIDPISDDHMKQARGELLRHAYGQYLLKIGRVPGFPFAFVWELAMDTINDDGAPDQTVLDITDAMQRLVVFDWERVS